MTMDDTENKEESQKLKIVIPEWNVLHIKEKFDEKEYYDAYSLVTTYARRCINRNAYDEATSLYHEFAMKFIQNNRFDLACELGHLMVTLFMEASFPVTQERIDLISDIFSVSPETPEVSRHRFIEHALKWATKESGVDSPFVLQLHHAIGMSYKKEKLYGLAQGHLVFCHDGELLGELLAEWLKQGYPSERPLFVLRAILLLLAKKDIQTAEDTLNSRALHLDLEDINLPPALQFAYLIIEACKAQNTQLFDLLTSKYSLVIRRDKLFSEFLEMINKKIFGRQLTNKNFSLLNMFSSLFGNASPISSLPVSTLS